jgi:hypothetical protein
LAVERKPHVLGRVGFRTFASTPHHVDRCAELDAQIDRVERLGAGPPPHRGVVGRERTFLEHGIREQVRRRHRHLHARVVQGAAEPLQDRLAFGGRRAGRDQVVVVEVDAVRAELGEALHGLDRIEWRARLVAERITTDIADGPQPEGEALRSRRYVLIVHGLLAHGDLRNRACRASVCSPP